MKIYKAKVNCGYPQFVEKDQLPEFSTIFDSSIHHTLEKVGRFIEGNYSHCVVTVQIFVEELKEDLARP